MKHLSRFLFPVLLCVITLIICILNYTPGTYLTGWDTLHPEFNFAQQFSNEFFGAFRTDQGLGAVAAHAHMSELPRLFFLWLGHFILPLSFLRYSIVFLCFILGPLGIYFFIKKILPKKNQYSIFHIEFAAFLGALFYIFNLETVQQFYVPFEMFLVQYAFLGWLFLTAINYIQKPKTRNLAIFALVSLLASPMAYASVLWYAYFAILSLFLLGFFVLNRSKKTFLLILALLGVTLITNAYWILPNFYFLLTAAHNVTAAQTNRIFSDEAFLYNKEYGNIFDTAILRNFLFSWMEQENINNSKELLSVWKNHLANPFTIAIGYVAFMSSIIGIFISIFKKNKIGIALIPVFVISLIMVMNMNFPFEIFFSYVRNNSSLFKEGLRFPFTKFGPLLMFSMSIFFAICMDQILEIAAKIKTKYLHSALPILFGIIVSIALIWYGFPMFTGNLIDQRMRVSIPKEYFDLYKYLDSAPTSARVAPLPLQSMWGWQYNKWGYQGAGFLWFGLKQPVLARDFDRWNPENEQYFREMSTALYSRDAAQVEALARKYKISYFILDKSIYSPGEKNNALWQYETRDTFEKSKNIKLVKRFGDLEVYKVDGNATGFIQKPSNITFVGPQITGGFVDVASQNEGDYVVSNDPDFTYFGRNLVDRYDRVDPKNIVFDGKNIILSLGKNAQYNLTDTWKSSSILPEFIRESYDPTIEHLGLPFTVDDNQFIFFPVDSEQINVAKEITRSTDCGPLKRGSISQITKGTNSVTFKALDAASCGYVAFPTAKEDFGSLFTVEAKNVEGLPTRLCISENITNRCGIYTVLDSGNSWKKYVFMIPPLPSGASGYAVHFNTIGVGNSQSINSVRNAQLIQIPYYRIANLSFIKDGYQPRPNGITQISTVEVNPSLYKVSAKVQKDSTGLINLNKSYDAGWIAYTIPTKDNKQPNIIQTFLPFLFGKEIKQHVIANSWANGWLITPETSGQLSIVIIYLPQYLEYVGILILVIFVIYLIYKAVHHRYNH